MVELSNVLELKLHQEYFEVKLQKAEDEVSFLKVHIMQFLPNFTKEMPTYPSEAFEVCTFLFDSNKFLRFNRVWFPITCVTRGHYSRRDYFFFF